MRLVILRGRSLLQLLYKICGVLAGAFLVSVALIITYDLLGPIFGYIPESSDELAGYFAAASAFLGLAYTFAAGKHIQVTVISRLAPRSIRQMMTIATLVIASGISVYFAWFSVQFALDSWRFHDVSTGLVATPLWIPQSAMALGTSVFALAVLERLLNTATELLRNIDPEINEC